MNEESIPPVETATTATGVNYESAITSALTAQGMAGGPRLEQDPDPAAWRTSDGREAGPALAGGLLARPLPDYELEAGR